MAQTYTLRLEVEGKDRGAGSMLDGLKGDMKGAEAAAASMGDKISSGMKKAEAAAASMGDKIAAGMRNAGQAMQGFGAKLSVGVTAPILGFAAAAIKGAADAEQLMVSFTTMLGSAEKAQTLLTEISKFAASTPFESTEIQNAAKQLLAFGTDAKDIIPTLTTLGDIAAGLNIPIGDLAYLFGTLKAQGRAFMADINQFSGRGVPIIKALAKVMKVAEKDVRGLVEAGKVGFPEVQAALASLTEEGGQFAGLMAAQSTTFSGLMSTISDNIALTMTAIGTAIIEGFDLKEGLTLFIGWLERAKNAIISFAATNPQMFKFGLILAGIAAAAGPLILGLGTLLTVLAPLAPAFAAMAGALVALVSPLGLVVVGVGALIALNWDSISGAISTLTANLKNYWEATQDAGFGTKESKDAISLLPSFIQPAALALDDLARSISDLLPNLREIPPLFALVWANSGLLNVALSAVPDNLKPILEPLLQITAAMSDFAIDAQSLADAMREVWANSALLSPILAIIPENLKPIAEPLLQITAAMSDLASDMKALASAMGAVWANTALLAPILAIIPDHLKGIADPLLNATAAMSGFAGNALAMAGAMAAVWANSALLGVVLSVVPETLKGIAEPLLTATAAMSDFATALADFITTGNIAGLKAVFDGIRDAIGAIDLPTISDVWSAAKIKITTLVNEVDWTLPVTALAGLVTSVTTAITGVNWNSVGVAVGKAVSAALSADIITPLMDTAMSGLGAIWVASVKAGMAIAEWVIDPTSFAGLVTAIVTSITNIDWSGVTTAFAGLKTAITKAISDFTSGFFEGFNKPDLTGLHKEDPARDVMSIWSQKIPPLDWTTFIKTALEWKTFIPTNLSWGTFIPAVLVWSAWIESKLQWSSWISEKLQWSNWIEKKLNWADWVSYLTIPSGGTTDADVYVPKTNDGQATGTSFWRGGPTWVGERGPELVNLPRGSQVYTNRESMAMAAAGPNVNLYVQATSDLDIEQIAYRVADVLRRKVR